MYLTCPPDQCQGYEWCDYPDSVSGTCSLGDCRGSCSCLSLTCSKSNCNAPCLPGETQTESCSYCQGILYCEGSKTRSCTNYCTWGPWSSCSASSCRCVVGYCGVSDASQCCPSGTYYKYNPWSGKWKCCDSQTDCVDYDGNCIDNGGWSDRDGFAPVDYCSNGSWIRGWCVMLNSTCVQYFPYIYTTVGCSIYQEVGCLPHEVKAVIAIENPQCFNDGDCPGYDPNTHLKLYCHVETLTCKPLERCRYNSQCEPGWCCDRDPGLSDPCKGSGVCVQKGSIMCNDQYICDPPEGFDRVSKLEQESKENPSNKKLTLLDLLANLFHFPTR